VAQGILALLDMLCMKITFCINRLIYLGPPNVL